MGKKLDVKYPPVHGLLSAEEFMRFVDHESFPKCTCCGQPIYNPDFYEDEDLDMCGPCTTGEADTIMWHEDEIDDRYASKEFEEYYLED